MTPEQLIHAHLTNFGNPTQPEIYAEDIEVTFPYAPKHHTGRRVGREAIIQFLTNVGVYFRDIKLSNARIVATADPAEYVVEVDGNSVSVETDLPYSQHYISFFKFADGKIASIREFYNPIEVLVSTGEIKDPSEA